LGLLLLLYYYSYKHPPIQFTDDERLEGSLDAFAARRDLKLTHVRNDDWIGPNACRCRRRNPSWATDSCS